MGESLFHSIQLLLEHPWTCHCVQPASGNDIPARFDCRTAIVHSARCCGEPITSRW